MDPAAELPPSPAYGERMWLSRPKFQDRRWLHLLLFVLTFLSTTGMGVAHYLGFLGDFTGDTPALSLSEQILGGLWYSGTILAILGVHELGHYFACRYYDVDASLPYFLPAPFVTGTIGAFIRIREPIPSKRMLFDIGIAGPIAGFLVAVPALFIGVAMSRMSAVPPDMSGWMLGEPLLFQAAANLLWGPRPPGFDINLHPIGFAAWFGLLATALNLLPIGQLDGGHISYAVLGRRSSTLTVATVVGAIGLSWFSRSWLVWTVLMIVMLALFGRHHPQTFDEHVPLDRPRLVLAGIAVAIFVVCFTPAPVEPIVR